MADMAIGRGTAPAHHGEVLQGVFHTEDGRLLRGVVSLPYPQIASQALFTPTADERVVVRPLWRSKARTAAELTLWHLGVSQGGVLVVESDIPIERGLGSSTADVASAISAVCAAFGRSLTESEAACLAVQAERASDSTVFADQTVLFANRVGTVLEELAGPLPALEVLGFDTGVDGVDTLRVAGPLYSAWEVGEFRALRGALRRATESGSATLLARVCTASARINLRRRPAPLASVETVIRRAGALGYQIAHSGTIVGVLFDPAAPDLESRVAEGTRLLRTAGVETLWRFSVPGPPRHTESIQHSLEEIG